MDLFEQRTWKTEPSDAEAEILRTEEDNCLGGWEGLKERQNRDLHPVWHFFTFEAVGYSCSTCNVHFRTARNCSNALKHLKSKHTSSFNEAVEKMKEWENRRKAARAEKERRNSKDPKDYGELSGAVALIRQRSALALNESRNSEHLVDYAGIPRATEMIGQGNTAYAERERIAWNEGTESGRQSSLQSVLDWTSSLPNAQGDEALTDPPSALKFRNLLVMPTVPLSFFLSKEFREFCNVLNPSFDVPTSSLALRTILSVPVAQLKKNLGERVRNSATGGAACTVDIWSGKGVRQSYIAVTAHFVPVGCTSVESCFLGIKILGRRHSSEKAVRAFQKILEEAHIDETMVHRVVVDNAANMAVGPTWPEGVELSMASRSSNVAEETCDWNSDLGDETTSDEDDDMVNEYDAESELEDSQLSQSFPSRISTAAHDLQMVLHRVVDNNEGVQERVGKLISLLKKMRKSSKASRLLFEKTGGTVVLPRDRMWKSITLFLERYLKIANSVSEVAQEMAAEFEQLPREDEQFYSHLCQILRLFGEQIGALQGDSFVALSHVYPSFQTLRSFVQRYYKSAKFADCKELLGSLDAEMARKFAKVFDVTSEEFDCSYAASTVLDPAVAASVAMSMEGIVQQWLTAKCREEESGIVHETEVPAIESNSVLPSLKQPKCSADEGDQQEPRTKKQKLSEAIDLVDVSVSSYVDSVFYHYSPTPRNALEYWSNYEECESLRRVALKMLSTPASSAPVERAFSSVRLAVEERNNRTGKLLLENCLFLFLNTKLNPDV